MVLEPTEEKLSFWEEKRNSTQPWSWEQPRRGHFLSALNASLESPQDLPWWF
jgi:hypothetical protein